MNAPAGCGRSASLTDNQRAVLMTRMSDQTCAQLLGWSVARVTAARSAAADSAPRITSAPPAQAASTVHRAPRGRALAESLYDNTCLTFVEIARQAGLTVDEVKAIADGAGS